MSARDAKPPVVVVTGPTSAGKSAWALELALRFDAEIVNADSMQVYRHMDIGTAKPDAETRGRAPHHLYDVANPDEAYSAGRYLREARAAAAQIHARGRAVLLTGGTGLYVRAFLEGLAPGAGGADPTLRAALMEEHRDALACGEPERLHTRLAAIDPETARGIHPHDVVRVVRALEIRARSGQRPSELRGAHAFGDRPYRSLHLALDPGPAGLDERIDGHCRRMLDAGLLREVRALRQRGYGPELRSMQALGYRHLQPVVEGRETLENALVEMQRDTRRFARRQRTWLRKVPDVVWMHPDARDALLRRVEAFLTEGRAPQST